MSITAHQLDQFSAQDPGSTASAPVESMTVKAAPRFTLRPTSIGKIVGHAQTLRDVLSTIDRVANSTCTVLVTGESGTGKELIVAALHDASPR